MLWRSLIRQQSRRSVRQASSSSPSGQKYPFDMHFHVSPVHKYLGIAYGATMWLWVFYRFKQDGAALLGLEHPWDHHSHDDHHHSTPYQYEKLETGQLPNLVEED